MSFSSATRRHAVILLALCGAVAARAQDDTDRGPRPGAVTPPSAWEPKTAPVPDTRPKAGPVSPTMYLPASVAKVTGRGLRYEKGAGRDNIGFWSDPNGTV
ncbi:MAG: hypothetical protein ISS72_04045, partial [Candidatus Brocadiae bacterium]|nr:hypothetical protein [Candidatus Brocadiia bacterium]